MNSILYLVPYHPYPPNHGGQAVIYHKLCALSKFYRIHLVCPELIGQKFDTLHPPLESFCAGVHFYTPELRLPPLGKSRFFRELLLSISQLAPSSAALFYSRSLPRLIEKIAQQENVDLLCIEHSYTYALLLDARRREPASLRSLPLVVCEQNVEHIVLRDAARDPTTRWPVRMVRRWEQAKTFYFTRLVYRRAQAVSYLARTDMEVFCKLDWNAHLFLTPPIIPLAPRRHVPKVGHQIVLFTSSLGYFPNQAGLTWFYKSVWPLVSQHTPQARLRITGHPTERLRIMLVDDPSVELMGFLGEEALEECLAEGDVAIAPIWLGSGIKIKIILALSYGLPLVATSKSVAGIEAVSGQDLIVADAPEAFAEQISNLLVDESRRRQLSRNAYQAYVNTYAPKNALRPWIKLFDGLCANTTR